MSQSMMNDRRWRGVSRCVVLGLAAFTVVALACTEDETTESTDATRAPNVLFILVDDARWDVLGAYGNADVRTPNLDRFAAEGMRLDGLHTASPICNPSRASFLTGRYPDGEGLSVQNPRTAIEPGTPTVAHIMRRAGYVTGFVGKSHLGGNPRRWGFEEIPINIPDAHFADWKRRFVLFEDWKPERYSGHATERLADRAIRFIEDHRAEPWFLWLATTAPHYPYVASPDFPFQASEIRAPAGWPSEYALPSEVLARYYSLLGRLDREIGRVLDALDAQGLADDTLVFITSDNGLEFGAHGFEAKGTWFDTTARVPGLVRWPGRVAAGSTSRELVSSVDWLPTLRELTDQSADPELPGNSFLPVLRGEKSTRKLAYAMTRGATSGRIWNWTMVTDGRFKLVSNAEGELTQFYDLADGSHETRSRLGQAEYAAEQSALEEALAEFLGSPLRRIQSPRDSSRAGSAGQAGSRSEQ